MRRAELTTSKSMAVSRDGGVGRRLSGERDEGGPDAGERDEGGPDPGERAEGGADGFLSSEATR